MLLEEALANQNINSNNSTPSTTNQNQNQQQLSPHETALALLSFLRDELPAGGTSAEKRFINLFPLINNRIFGEYNTPNNNSEGNNTIEEKFHDASPSPRGSPNSVGGSPSSSPSSGVRIENYRHLDGGWLCLYPSPAAQQQQQRNSPNSPRTPINNRPNQQKNTLESDPIIRLLRAPKPLNSSPSSNNNNNNTVYTPPTLIDCISIESIHRPSCKFKLNLGLIELVNKPLVGDWELVYWNEIEKQQQLQLLQQNNVQRGGFGHQQTVEKVEVKKVEEGKVGKENGTRILLKLLLSPGGGASTNNGTAMNQMELKSYFTSTYQQRKSSGQSQGSRQQNQSYTTPLKSHLINGGLSSRSTTTPGGGSNDNNNNTEPSIELTMLEYYLFLFIRYPLANINWDVQLSEYQRRRKVYGGRIVQPYGQRIYSYLLNSYMNYYIPQNQVYDMKELDVGCNCFDGKTTSTTANGMNVTTLSAPTAGNKSSSMERTSELFLRLIIEFWMEGQNVMLTTNEGIARYRRVRSGVMSSSTTSGGGGVSPSLSDSLELSQPQLKFVAPPPQIQTYALTLVRHLVSDRSMRELIKKVSNVMQTRQKEEREGKVVPNLVSEASSSSGDGLPNNSITANVSWCLPPAMTAVQPSLFNYIRSGLACGAIHDRSSIFHKALETWLVWLEPWNYILKRRVFATSRQGGANSGSGTPSSSSGGSRGAAESFLRNAAATVSSHHRVEYVPSYVQPKPTSPSKYTAEWEAYVVSNVHYFTVPLAIFMKRARELEFSNNSEYPRSLALVQRVLRIYSKGVVNVLNSVLNSRADGLSTLLFTQHGVNMGPFCPPTNANWKLTNCQQDATNLLEEVFSQHQKRQAAMDVFDRLEAKLNGLFTGKMGSDEAALDSLLTHVRSLVNLPLDYQVLPEEVKVSRGFGLWRLLGLDSTKATSTTAASTNLLVPERGSDGKLTDIGRRQLYAGLAKCNALDCQYIGDPMLSRVKSYEMAILVDLTIKLSNYLNQKLDLVPPLSAEEEAAADEDDALLKKYNEMQRYQKIKYRINLRFLADSRNIIFASIVWWIVKSIRGLFGH